MADSMTQSIAALRADHATFDQAVEEALEGAERTSLHPNESKEQRMSSYAGFDPAQALAGITQAPPDTGGGDALGGASVAPPPTGDPSDTLKQIIDLWNLYMQEETDPQDLAVASKCPGGHTQALGRSAEDERPGDGCRPRREARAQGDRRAAARLLTLTFDQPRTALGHDLTDGIDGVTRVFAGEL
jgi:hypothetical protein